MAAKSTNFMTGDSAFAVDRDGVIVLWNPAAEKVLGYPAAIALGRQCWELLRGTDTYGNRYCGEHCPVREMAFQHRSVNGFKVIYRTATDERKQFVISCLAVFDNDDNELLLHICRPEKNIPKDENGDAITTSSSKVHASTLTRREHEALTLLADGKNNREIAAVMLISVPTVRNHIQHVLRKLNVHTRLEAVVLCKRLDLI